MGTMSTTFHINMTERIVGEKITADEVDALVLALFRAPASERDDRLVEIEGKFAVIAAACAAFHRDRLLRDLNVPIDMAGEVEVEEAIVRGLLRALETYDPDSARFSAYVWRTLNTYVEFPTDPHSISERLDAEHGANDDSLSVLKYTDEKECRSRLWNRQDEAEDEEHRQTHAHRERATRHEWILYTLERLGLLREIGKAGTNDAVAELYHQAWFQQGGEPNERRLLLRDLATGCLERPKNLVPLTKSALVYARRRFWKALGA